MKKLTALTLLTLATAMAFGQTTLVGQNSVAVELVESTGQSQNYEYNNQYWAFGNKVIGGVSSYLSYGVCDFNASAIAGQNITSATFEVGNDNYHPVAGNFTVYAVTDNTTDYGTTQLTYDPNVVGGYSGQLGAATSLGTFYYDGTGGSVLDYTLSGSGFAALEALANTSNHDIRLVFTGDGTSYTTFNGTGNSDPTLVPQLIVNTQAVPEPIGIFAISFGIIGLAFRRRN